MSETVLVRYGIIAEVARFRTEDPSLTARGQTVVVQTHRGLELGTVLERVRPEGPKPRNGHSHEVPEVEEEVPSILRVATRDDMAAAESLRVEAQTAFGTWIESLRGWKLDLDLVDLEWTLDRAKLILYVLSGRGPEATKLALYAAARGTPVEVQPVNAEGLVALPSGAGCGSGECGCH